MHIVESEDGQTEIINDGVSLMDLFGSTTELEIFNTEAVKDVI